MIKIALMGEPGSGKTTLASAVFSKLKDKGYRGDLVQEYIREHINRNKQTPNILLQAIVYERQLERENILPHKIDFMVTDSPTLLSYIYATIYTNPKDLDQVELLTDLYSKTLRKSLNRYDLVYFLEPNFQPDLNDGTRYQTADESALISRAIRTFMDVHKVPYKILDSSLTTKQRTKIIKKDFKDLISKKIVK